MTSITCWAIRHCLCNSSFMTLTRPLPADKPLFLVHQPVSLYLRHQVEHCFAERLREILAATPQVNITATGSSMTPFVRSGERVTLQRVKSPFSLHCGDILLFSTPSDRLLLHRIITAKLDSENITLQTKGDNRFVPDVVICHDIIAKVIRLEKDLPFLGHRSFDLESKCGKLVGRTLAWSSRFNIHLRCWRFLSRLKKFIFINCITNTNSIS